MTTSKRVHLGFLVLSGALSVQSFAACSGDHAVATHPGAGGTAGSGGNGGAGPTTTGSGTGGVSTTATNPNTTGGVGPSGPSTTGGPAYEYLFECGFDLSCAPVCSHLGGLGDCGGDGACVDSVWDSGERGGAVMLQSRPGPGGYQSDTLFVLLGDGQVLTQLRSRECPGDDLTCDLEAVGWELGRPERCEMGSSHTLQVTDCVTAEYSCDDVKDIVAGVGGTGGAGGSAGGGGDAGGGAEAGRAGEAAE